MAAGAQEMFAALSATMGRFQLPWWPEQGCCGNGRQASKDAARNRGDAPQQARRPPSEQGAADAEVVTEATRASASAAASAATVAAQGRRRGSIGADGNPAAAPGARGLGRDRRKLQKSATMYASNDGDVKEGDPPIIDFADLTPRRGENLKGLIGYSKKHRYVPDDEDDSSSESDESLRKKLDLQQSGLDAIAARRKRSSMRNRKSLMGQIGKARARVNSDEEGPKRGGSLESLGALCSSSMEFQVSDGTAQDTTHAGTTSGTAPQDMSQSVSQSVVSPMSMSSWISGATSMSMGENGTEHEVKRDRWQVVDEEYEEKILRHRRREIIEDCAKFVPYGNLSPRPNNQRKTKAVVNLERKLEMSVAAYEGVMQDRIRQLGAGTDEHEHEHGLDKKKTTKTLDPAKAVIESVRKYHQHCQELGKVRRKSGGDDSGSDDEADLKSPEQLREFIQDLGDQPVQEPTAGGNH